MINPRFVFATVLFVEDENSATVKAMKTRPFMADTVADVINDVLNFTMLGTSNTEEIDMIFVNDVSKRMDGHVF